jgi:hypothetical protein
MWTQSHPTKNNNNNNNNNNKPGHRTALYNLTLQVFSAENYNLMQVADDQAKNFTLYKNLLHPIECNICCFTCTSQ